MDSQLVFSRHKNQPWNIMQSTVQRTPLTIVLKIKSHK